MKNETEHRPVYRTGPTDPPKRYGSLVAILLMAVILLGGLASILGIMNIRLVGKLSLDERDHTPISFTATKPPKNDPRPANAPLGLLAQPVSPFLQRYHHLPQGAYITAVEQGSLAEAAGLMSGDIVVRLKDRPITDDTALLEALEACQGAITLSVYRGGEEISLILTLN